MELHEYNRMADVHAARLALKLRREGEERSDRRRGYVRMAVVALLLILCVVGIRELRKPLDGGRGFDGHKMANEAKGRFNADR